MPDSTLTRRRFSHRLALAASSLVAAPAILRGQNLNNKLNVAVIGAGGRGGGNLSEVAKTENITALCDVNGNNLAAASARFPQAKTFVDFRRMFEDGKANSFDAVIVSTCEHTHAFATMLALKA